MIANSVPEHQLWATLLNGAYIAMAGNLLRRWWDVGEERRPLVTHTSPSPSSSPYNEAALPQPRAAQLLALQV